MKLEAISKPCSYGEARTPPPRRCGVSPHQKGGFEITSLEKIVTWLDKTLNVSAFDDVSNNGLQVARTEDKRQQTEIRAVAFAVDASVRAVKAAAQAGAQLLVVHHGISWGGGVKRLSGGVYNVVKAAMDANLAIYACHLPLDAHPVLGNNAQLAKLLGLKKTKPAFNYHGNVIGLVGELENVGNVGNVENVESVIMQKLHISHISHIPHIPHTSHISLGICSGGAGEFAEEAKRLGCDVYLTGEASWGDVIAAENCGMKMICAGHYETEVFGVRAVAAEMKKVLKVKTVDLTEELKC